MPPRRPPRRGRRRLNEFEAAYLSNAVLDECRGKKPYSLVGRGPKPNVPARVFLRLLEGGYVGLDGGEPYLTRDGREAGIAHFVQRWGARPESVAYDELVGAIAQRMPRRRLSALASASTSDTMVP